MRAWRTVFRTFACCSFAARPIRNRVAAILCIPLLALLPTGPRALAIVRYVDADAPGPGHGGGTWPTAFLTVQAALDAAAPGDEVWVAVGIYGESITMKGGVALYGGFAGTETDLAQRNTGANPTVLDGGGTSPVVEVPPGAAATTVLDGFTVRNGLALRGGGIFCGAGARAVIRNNTIIENRSQTDYMSPSGGGGLYLDNASPTVEHNTIRANSSDENGAGLCAEGGAPVIVGNTIVENDAGLGSGGGIYCGAGTPAIRDNVIEGNSAFGRGGGVACVSAAATLSGNSVRDNEGTSGGGIGCTSGTVILRNNVVTGNRALPYSGGGILCEATDATIINSVIAANSAAQDGAGIAIAGATALIANNTVVGNTTPTTQARGGGVHLATGTLTLINNIIAYNAGGVVRDGGSPLVRYNDVFGNNNRDYEGIASQTGTNGNISADPRLASSAFGNYHIQPDSPCRNTGDNAAVQADWLDMDSQPRIQPAGGVVDMGADESDGTDWGGGGGAVVYVRADGNDASDGSTWKRAKKTVQAGTTAAEPGSEVWVAAGTYKERITLKSGVALFGGFAGTEAERAQRDRAANPTALDGEQQGRVVLIPANAIAGTIIDGFIIENGSEYRGGAGIYCEPGSKPVIRNNIIRKNLNGSDYGGPKGGGGIRSEDASPTITGNLVQDNTADGFGGGIACAGGAPVITGNVVQGNNARQTGPYRGYAGAVCLSSCSTVLFTNNVLTGNRAGTSSAGLYVYDGTLTIVNNTFVKCSVDAQAKTGVVLEVGKGTVLFANNIVAFNEAGIYKDTGTITFRGNCFYANAGQDFQGVADPVGQNGNIRADPRLASLAGDHHIQPDSPCREAGDNAAVQEGWTDMDGEPRIQPAGGTVDIGADESNGTIHIVPPLVVYVKPTGSDTNDGLSWVQAKRTMKEALKAGMGGEVWVMKGTYYGALKVSNVAVYGGFAGTETQRGQREVRLNLTVLDGSTDEKGNPIDLSVVTIPPESGVLTVVDGFTIQRGEHARGGGIFCEGNSTPAIRNNTITHNVALTDYGGGLYCADSAPLIENNVVSDNVAPVLGAGLYVSGGAPRIASNIIMNNTNAQRGGGLYCRGAGGAIVNNTVVGNASKVSGGGIYLEEGTTRLDNNIVLGNTSGLYTAGTALPAPSHNCAYMNVTEQAPRDWEGRPDPTGQDGNIKANPNLYNVEAQDFHLLGGSPCRDAGDDAAVQPGDVDLDGNSRLRGAHVDIGAYEIDPTVPVSFVVRVRWDGNDSNDGSAWDKAKKTITAAIAAAPEGEVWVMAGPYQERIALKTTAVFGGFAGTETARDQRDVRANLTALDGSGLQGSVVMFEPGATEKAVFDGFTVMGGTAAKGGGIYCAASTRPTIRNNTITGNSATAGGGIYVDNASPTITGNIVDGNTAGNGNGGGLHAYFGTPLIKSNLFVNNEAGRGGGVYANFSSVVVANNTLAHNTAGARGGGGIFITGGTASLVNNLIARNTSGVFRTGASLPAPRANCAFGNGTAQAPADWEGLADPTGGNGNIAADPLFTGDPGDYHLLAGSPCADAGDDTTVEAGEVDLDGNPRLRGAHVDIGALEMAGAALYTVAEAARALRLALGAVNAQGTDATRLDTATDGASAARVDLRDAVRVIRKAAGLDPNP